jgi:DNA topoisomerase I
LLFNLASPPISSAKIPGSLDKKMDKQNPSNGDLHPGISIRNGPVSEDVAMPDANGPMTNGTGPAKRKARASTGKPNYAGAESSDDDVPLVCASARSPCKDLIG